MIRIKNYDSTGVAPNGILFAGDLNALEDAVAALSDFTQTLDIGTLRVGETGLQLIRYGAGEARITGLLRVDGILRALSGLITGAYTTTQRDAIALGSRPFTMIIFNTTNNRLEINLGTDATPNWQPFGSSLTRGTLGARPAAALTNQNSFYFATDDNGGTIAYSDGTVWTKLAKGLTEAPNAHASSHARTGSDPIDFSTYNLSGTLAARPTAGSVAAGVRYLATDVNGGTGYLQIAGSWVQNAHGVNIAASEVTSTMVASSAITPAKMDFTQIFDFAAVGGLKAQGKRVQRHPYANDRHIESGVVAFGSVSNGGNASASVTFTTAGSSSHVVTGLYNTFEAGGEDAFANSVTGTGFTAAVGNIAGSAQNMSSSWIADIVA